LGILDRESSEYEAIRTKLEELNIFDNQMIELHEKFVSLEEKYENTVEKLTQDIQLLSTHISDKTLLNQINYRVFKTDKKLDTVSKDISTKIDTSTNQITKKLDEVKIAIIKTNNQKLNSFLENVYRSNQALASKIQMMYHQNDRVNRKAKDALNNSIQSMNNEISTLLDRPIVSSTNSNTQEIKDIVEASNWRFYKGIQGLCEKESDSYNCKLLEMSIAFTKREHELHIENLERSLEDKNKETIALNTQLKDLNQWLDDINEKYETKKIRSLEVEEQFLKIRKEKDVLKKNMLQVSDITNKSINLDKYKNEIKRLEKEVSRLNGKTEQLHELKESISLSSKTADSLVSLEKNYEDKIGLIEDKFKKIKHNPKNEKRLREIFKSILDLEKKLEEIKENNSTQSEYDPNITLRLVENDLKKIEKIMSKRKFNLYSLYCKTRFVIIGVIGMTLLLLYEPFWELCKQLLAF